MPLPRPEPGLVIHYDYLWRNEYEMGADEGSKKRPCAVVVAIADAAGVTTVVVAPVTHSAPRIAANGIEIPPRVKKHLGLDEQRSWIIASDLNTFIWPGYDLHPIPDAPPGTYAYGFLPPALHRTLVDRIVLLSAQTTPRD